MKITGLRTAPAAVTDTSAALLWDRPERFGEKDFFYICVNGRAEGRCRCTDYTVNGLTPGTEYEISIGTEENGAGETLTVRTAETGKMLDIRLFGAVGDGKTVNTEAIQRALDAAGPNDWVVVPEGDQYRSVLQP